MTHEPRKDAEQLAWELPRVDADSGAEVPRDDRLRAYREGTLSELEERRIEWILSRNARARARLAELAGVAFAEPPRRVRRRVLGDRSVRRWQLAAALFVTVLLAWVGIRWIEWRDETPSTPMNMAALPADLEYDIQVEGLATTRSGAGALLATAATEVRIVVEPRRQAVAGLEFGVYRLNGAMLERLVPGDDLTVTAQRGAATLSTAAHNLIGPDPGTRDFFVVVARAGVLPRGGELRDRPAAEWLAAASGGRVYRRSLTILDER